MPSIDTRHAARRIVGLYVAISVIWLVCSDTLLSMFVVEQHYHLIFATGKGMLFIAVTAGLLHALLSRAFRKMAAQQKALQEIDQRLQFAIEATGDGVWDWDIVNDKVNYSTSCKSILGYGEDEIGDSLAEWETRVHPDDWLACRSALDKHLIGQSTYYNSEYRLRHKDGSYSWVLARGMVVERSADGTPLRAVGTVTDISTHRRLEEDLRQSREMFRLFMQHTPAAVFIKDTETRHVFVNDHFLQVFNADTDDVIGKTNSEIFPSTIARQITEEDYRILQEGVSTHSRMQIPRGDDTFSWEVYKFAIPDEARNNTYLGGIAIDITEQQALAEERDRLFSRLRLLFDRLPIGCIVTDPDLVVNEWNPAAEQIFGFTKDEMILRNPLTTIFSAKARSELDQTLEKLITGDQTKSFIAENLTKEGKTIVCEWHATPLREQGGLIGILAMGQDITERIRTDEAVLQYQERLRNLAASLTVMQERERRSMAMTLHDGVGQPLALARIKLGYLRSLPLNADHQLLAAEITGLVEQSIDITRSLTTEISPPILYQVGLSAALEDLVETFRIHHGLPVTFQDDCLEKPLTDDIKIFFYQAVRELLMNALKHASASAVQVLCNLHDDTIEVSVIDNGAGFPIPATASLEIDSGYGLFNIGERVQHLGGSMRIDSAPGQGTAITISLAIRRHLPT